MTTSARSIFILLGLTACIVASGCAATENWNKPMGEHGFNKPIGAAYQQQLNAQKFDPVPPATTPVTGMDGQLSENVINTYQNPKPEDKGPTFNEFARALMDKQ